MILQFFNHGTGKSKSAINYLLSEKDSDGKIRNPPPEIFYGDPDLTGIIIDTNPRKFKYTSGVIAFRDHEKPTKKQLNTIIKAFYETFAPGLGPERINMLIVRHEDKGNTELHLLIPMVDVKTQKQFNIDPPGKHATQMVKDFSAIWNHNLGYEQVIKDPLRSEFSAFDKKAPTGKHSKSIKNRFSIEIPRLMRLGTIKNRDDLINFLEDKGHEITRRGQDFISIKFKGDEKAIRFKGPVFRGNSDYSALIKEADEVMNKKYLTKAELSEIKDRLQTSTNYRKDFIKKRIDQPKRMPKGYRPKVVQPIDTSPVINNKLVNTQPKQSTLDSTKKPLETIPTARRKGSQNATSSPSTRVMSTGATTNLKASLASVQTNIISAIADLSNAKTPEEKAKLERRLAMLRIQEAKLQHQIEEAKKAELNLPKLK